MAPDDLARLFHETYERLAPGHGYETRKASAVPWQDVPVANKRLMIAVAGELLPGLRKRWFEDLFGTPDEFAARTAEALSKDDLTALCERARPGEHAQRVLHAATKEQWEERISKLTDEKLREQFQPMIERITDAAMAERAALIERLVRAKVAEEIEETIDADVPGDFEAGLERAARVARQEPGA